MGRAESMTFPFSKFAFACFFWVTTAVGPAILTMNQGMLSMPWNQAWTFVKTWKVPSLFLAIFFRWNTIFQEWEFQMFFRFHHWGKWSNLIHACVWTLNHQLVSCWRCCSWAVGRDPEPLPYQFCARDIKFRVAEVRRLRSLLIIGSGQIEKLSSDHCWLCCIFIFHIIKVHPPQTNIKPIVNMSHWQGKSSTNPPFRGPKIILRFVHPQKNLQITKVCPLSTFLLEKESCTNYWWLLENIT